MRAVSRGESSSGARRPGMKPWPSNMATVSTPWRCCRTGAWPPAATTAGSDFGPGTDGASSSSSTTGTLRSGPWRCSRTGGWPAPALTAGSSFGPRRRGEPLVLGHGPAFWSLAVLPDGRLVTGDNDGLIKLWARNGRGELAVLDHGDDAVISLVVLPDGRLAGGGTNGRIKIWPAEGGQPVVLEHGEWVHSLVVLLDGRLVSGGADGRIKIWPAEGGGAPVVLEHGRIVSSLAVLPDGRLASGDVDGRIKLWPEHGPGEPVVLDHGGNWVNALLVLPDGWLASAGDDGRVKLWLVEEERLISALCLRAGRNLTQEEWNRYIGPAQPWQPCCRDRPSNWRTPDPHSRTSPSLQ